jgi:hypothetical protein
MPLDLQHIPATSQQTPRALMTHGPAPSTPRTGRHAEADYDEMTGALNLPPHLGRRLPILNGPLLIIPTITTRPGELP